MSCQYIDNKAWLAAIVSDNGEEVENILQTSNDETKTLLLNGEFIFPEPRLRIRSCLCEYDKDNRYLYFLFLSHAKGSETTFHISIYIFSK